MDIFEVEIRYSINDDSLSELNAKLINAKFKKRACSSQEDVYYSSKHKDFLETEECLRIRTVGEQSEITWKPPSTLEMKQADEFWKKEVDLNIAQQKNTAMILLESLDFFEVATVKKKRTTYSGPSGIELAIDDVEHAGQFIEIEVKHGNSEQGRRMVREVASLLSLDDRNICRIPYRDLVRNEKSTNN